MRRATLYLLGLFGVCAAISPAAASPSQVSDPVTRAKSLESKTVALVDEDGEVFCTGVWVSKTSIVTALHCVDDETVIAYATREGFDDDGMRCMRR